MQPFGCMWSITAPVRKHRDYIPIITRAVGTNNNFDDDTDNDNDDDDNNDTFCNILSPASMYCI